MLTEREPAVRVGGSVHVTAKSAGMIAWRRVLCRVSRCLSWPGAAAGLPASAAQPAKLAQTEAA